MRVSNKHQSDNRLAIYTWDTHMSFPFKVVPLFLRNCSWILLSVKFRAYWSNSRRINLVRFWNLKGEFKLLLVDSWLSAIETEEPSLGPAVGGITWWMEGTTLRDCVWRNTWWMAPLAPSPCSATFLFSQVGVQRVGRGLWENTQL